MATNEKKVELKRKPKKEHRFHPIRYCREMFGELKKLTWLTGKELFSHTLAVIVFVLVMAALIGVLDLAFANGLALISKIKIG
ncbi:MAG: preprotein translocase subunit SecE [Clostridia bacterium]